MSTYGLCECGCGGRTNVATKTNGRSGHVKGRPLRFLLGHASRTFSVEWIAEDRGHDTPCWIWQGSVHPNGYGRQRFEGRTTKAHRVAYARAYGPIPQGLGVLHRCDVPLCVRPDHLYAGTDQDNATDRVLRERTPSLLDAERVIQIRALCAQGWRQWDIAHAYGISQASVSDLKFRRTWSHLCP